MIPSCLVDEYGTSEDPPACGGDQPELCGVVTVEELAGVTTTDRVVGCVQHHGDENSASGRMEHKRNIDARRDDDEYGGHQNQSGEEQLRVPEHPKTTQYQRPGHTAEDVLEST